MHSRTSPSATFMIRLLAICALIGAGQTASAQTSPETYQVKRVSSDLGTGDNYGESVAIDGDTMVVGAPGKGGKQGAAYVFYRNQGGTNNWGQVKKLVASDAATGDAFGMSVGISGDTIVVGAPYKATNGTKSGAVYFFDRNNTGTDQWGQVIRQVSGDIAANDNFGWGVAISGDKAVVGAAGSTSNKGAAYVLYRNQGGTNNWGQKVKVTASDGATSDHFGYSVAIDQTTAVAGTFESGKPGAAYVFEQSQGGSDNWGQAKKLTAVNAPNGATLGYSVGVSGDYIVIGGPSYGAGGTLAKGGALVYNRNVGGSGNWGLAKELHGGTNYGWAVAIHGDLLAISEITGTPKGLVYVYLRQGTAQNWGLIAKSTPSESESSGYKFGVSVSVTTDTVVGGASSSSALDTGVAGAANVIGYSTSPPPPFLMTGGTSTWEPIREIIFDD